MSELFSIEVEQGLIGSMMLDSSCVFDVALIVNESSFYHKNHAILFKKIHDLTSASSAIDPLIIDAALTAEEKKSGITTEYLIQLVDATSNIDNAIQYAQIIADYAVKRGVAMMSATIIDLAQNSNMSSSELLAEVQKLAFNESVCTAEKKRGVNITDALRSALDRIERRLSGDYDDGVNVGIKSFDDRTRALKAGQLMILAARPSMGKTATALNFAFNAAAVGKKVKIISLESIESEITDRILSCASSVRLDQIKSSEIDDNGWLSLTAGIEKLKRCSISIDDECGLTVEQIRSRCRYDAMLSGLDLVVIDYLQIVRLPASNENKTDRVGHVTQQLKEMAKELKIPVILLSQLNRKCESRPDNRPNLSDLRDSGNIEQDADIVTFLYRDEVYNTCSELAGKLELITKKNRDGELGTDLVCCDLSRMKLSDFSDSYY